MQAKKEIMLQSIQLNRDIKAINSLNEELAEKTVLLQLESATNDLLSMISIQNNLRLNRSKLIQLVSAVRSTTDTYYQKLNEIDALKEEFAEEMPDICPLCGTDLNQSSGDLEGMHEHFRD
jgi:methyl-accepting chemotaxis protein